MYIYCNMLDLLYQYLLLFVDITTEEFAYWCKFIELRHFEKKVKLVDIEENELYVNFVVKGLVRKYFYRRTEEVITQIARQGELICSSVSFLSGKPSDYVVETIEPTTVLSISAVNMEKVYALGHRMERLGRLVIIDWLLKKEQWENQRIKLGPKDRFLTFLSENPDLFNRVPQKYLASYLNIKPETFSRYKHLIKSTGTGHKENLKAIID